ncbi:hypothetical protein NTE_00150 [Candidatus Nitrososphaera evergladensis SR1]|uniref:PepSY domain-containing protein n=1 Tax=Candidatus Nitrososphaera evergladensis SR1 TaxID=1459636 RepID=A0A075MN61_9ARCH|nr:hypothetical protein [Candidatus Nitrososphaera evergladensis]AIF82232.1 hypothetical protein NTE_00150 [Candidatus Nitrososphaera evergladensis SR1]
MEASGKSNRKTQMMVMAGVMAAVLATAAVFMTQPVLAQQGTNSTQSNNNQLQQQQQQGVPQLNGTVNLRDAAKAFLRDNVKVPFDSALNTAKGAVSNGTVIGGQLTVVQGYLVYAFKVANFDADTSQIVIVDAGNGSVLYTSGNMPLHFGGFGGGGYGCARGHFSGHHGMNWGDRAPWSSSPSSSDSGSSGGSSAALNA